MQSDQEPEPQRGALAPLEKLGGGSSTPSPATPPSRPKKRVSDLVTTLTHHPTMHLFVITALVVAGVGLIGWLLVLTVRSLGGAPSGQVATQGLSKSDLEQLTKQSATLGGAGQTLIIGSDTGFRGDILANKNLTVSGLLTATNLKVNNPLTVADLIVTNSISLQKALTVADLLSVKGGLNVSGDAAFGGNLTAGTLTVRNTNINGGVTFNGHLATAGQPLSITAGSVGVGGTVSISGNDTAGTVVINTGGGPSAGTLATITFHSAYPTAPHVLVSPVGSATGTLGYYITRTATGFTIGGTSPTTAVTYTFDYFVTQ